MLWIMLREGTREDFGTATELLNGQSAYVSMPPSSTPEAGDTSGPR
jgi:hypothetical protein